MKIYVKSTLFGFVPFDEIEYEKFQRVGAWEGYIEIKKQRNVQFHRKFFKMLNTVYENQEKYKNKDHLRCVLTINAGFYDTLITKFGTVLMPQSIAFNKMDNIKFKEFFNRFVDAVIEEFQYNDEDYKKILMDFLK